MKKVVSAVILVLVLGCAAVAQQNSASAPATKEDIQRYLEATNARKTVETVMLSMQKSIQQAIQRECTQSKDPNCEASLTKVLEDSMREMPSAEMLDAMIPVYEKYLTKADVDALVAFYNSPTGKKMSSQSGQMSAEAMAAIRPIMQKFSQDVTARLKAQLKGSSESAPKAPSLKP